MPRRLLLSALVTLAASAGCSGRSSTEPPSGSSSAALSAPAASYAYTYDPSGLVASVMAGGSVVAGAARVYDALGRVVRSGGSTLTYGPDGHVARVSGPGGVDASYLYDEAGQRIAKASGGAIVEAYAPEGVVTAGSLTETLEVRGRVFGVLRNGAFSAIAADARGTVVAGTNGATSLASPYGDRTSHPDVSSVIDYARRGYDPDLGTVRMGVRDYDARTGRFLQPDPLFLASPAECVKSPGECNLYGYAKASPLTYVDPDGRKIVFAPGVSEAYKNDVDRASAYVIKSPAGYKLMLDLVRDPHTITLRPPATDAERKTGPFFHALPPDKAGNVLREIVWDPRTGVHPREGGANSPALALAHEEAHAFQQVTNPSQFEKDRANKDATYSNLEEKRIITGVERSIASDLGETKRTSHFGSLTTTRDPASTK